MKKRVTSLLLVFTLVVGLLGGMLAQNNKASAAVSSTLTNTKDSSIYVKATIKTSDNSNGGKVKKLLKLRLKTGSMSAVKCNKFSKKGKWYVYKSKKYGGTLKVRVYSVYKLKIKQSGYIDYPQEIYSGTYTWERI